MIYLVFVWPECCSTGAVWNAWCTHTHTQTPASIVLVFSSTNLSTSPSLCGAERPLNWTLRLDSMSQYITPAPEWIFELLGDHSSEFIYLRIKNDKPHGRGGRTANTNGACEIKRQRGLTEAPNLGGNKVETTTPQRIYLQKLSGRWGAKGMSKAPSLPWARHLKVVCCGDDSQWLIVKGNTKNNALKVFDVDIKHHTFTDVHKICWEYRDPQEQERLMLPSVT